VKFPSG